MLVDRAKFEDIYSDIRASATDGGCSVLILVAPEADALAACRIVTTLLRGDNVPYKVSPVDGYGAVAEAAASAAADVRSVVLLNCGAAVDVEAQFAESSATIFVLDHHRPLHLRNVYSKRVFVLDTDTDPDDLPSDGEDLDGGDSDSESDSDDESDEERADEDKRSRKKSSETADCDAEEEESGARREDDEDDLDESTRLERAVAKRARDEDDAAAAEAAKRRRRKVRAYYDGTYEVSPSSALAFSLSDSLGRAGATELWLASVGITAMRDSWRLSDAQYDAFVTYLARHLRNLDSAATSRGADPDAAAGLPSQRCGGDLAGRVAYDPDELRFTLHRHWSLFDAVYYSNYVASRLSVWRADGRRKLQELLAKMGLSLEHSRQKFAFLPPEQRRTLKQKLRQYGPGYRLDAPFTKSFRRVGKSGETVSATDAAALVEALLEATHAADDDTSSQRTAQHAASSSSANAAAAAASSEGGEPAELDEVVVDLVDARSAASHAAWLAAFWRAYDATLPDDALLLAEGVEAACALQKGVVTCAVSMIEKKELTTLKHFRYAYVGVTSDDALASPLALRKLALFLLGVHAANGKWANEKAKPLVLLAERHDTFLVVGLGPTQNSQHASQRDKNKFGQSFRFAAEHIKADFKHDWFDTAVIELEKDDVQRFVESLHYILSAK